MKLIHQFTDSRNNITNKIFETKYGPKLVHSINPGTNEFVISFIFKGGSNIEELLGVTSGTAHFAEHILASNPNKKFKTFEERESFVSGNSKKPKIYWNAGTSNTRMSFYAGGSDTHTERYIQYLEANLDYPLENIPKYIEKERGIILAEKSRKTKDEKSSEIPFFKFMFEKSSFLHQYTIGTEDSIKKISVNDLKTYIEKDITLKNLIISIQSSKELTKEEIKGVERILSKLRLGEDLEFPTTDSFSKSEQDCFQKDFYEGTEIMFNVVEDKMLITDYKKVVLRYFLSNIFKKYTYNILREKDNLIYASQGDVYNYISYNQNIRTLLFTVSNSNLKEFLNKYQDLLENSFPKFLHSENCEEMFEDLKNKYIFPLTESYDRFYAEKVAFDLLEGGDAYEYDKAKEVAEKITLEEVIEYLPDFFVYKPTKIWIESPLPKEEIKKIVEESKLYQYYKSLPTSTTRSTTSSSRASSTKS